MKKNAKVTAVILTIIISVSILGFAFDGFSQIPIKAKSPAKIENTDDKRIAGDISSMTGVSVDEILAVRNAGMSWNDVLQELKTGKYQKGSDAFQRENRLSLSGMEEADLRKLKEEGFTDNELQQAILLIERLIFQLREITAGDHAAHAVPEPLISGGDKDDDLQKYRDIAARIDAKECLYLVLRLRHEFGSMEKALDEYLFSLQAGINLALYIADKEEYLRRREEKAAELGMQGIITAAKIEEKMLELLSQKKETDNTGLTDFSKAETQKTPESENSAGNDVLPDMPKPGLGSVMPENPADRIKKEIDLLDPMKTENGGIGR
ncbi:MAG: hypothetical protein ACOX4M_02585 [Acetivibrionales bacterium]